MMSLIDMTNLCNSKGYDLFPVRSNDKVKAILFKNNVFLKEGDREFKNWIECQKYVYSQLINKLKL